MLIKTELARVFIHKVKNQAVRLTDPEPSMSPEAVMRFYANTYPELISAKITGPDINDDAYEYKFETTMGTKG